MDKPRRRATKPASARAFRVYLPKYPENFEEQVRKAIDDHSLRELREVSDSEWFQHAAMMRIMLEANGIHDMRDLGALLKAKKP